MFLFKFIQWKRIFSHNVIFKNVYNRNCIFSMRICQWRCSITSLMTITCPPNLRSMVLPKEIKHLSKNSSRDEKTTEMGLKRFVYFTKLQNFIIYGHNFCHTLPDQSWPKIHHAKIEILCRMKHYRKTWFLFYFKKDKWYKMLLWRWLFFFLYS